MSLKPPSEDAVAKAFSILMASLNKENGREFISGDIRACAALPVPQLVHNVDAVQLAKLSLVRKMDRCVARMQNLRNLASPFHRLPMDVFAIILEGFPVWSPSKETTSIFDLLEINRIWRDTILNLPELWTAFPLDIPPKLAPLVLERAKNLPLTITYFPKLVKKYLEDAVDEVGTMELPPGLLEYALREGNRWKKIDFTLSCGLYEEVEELLEASTPALEVLRVSVKYPSFARTMGPFTLSPGPPLKELQLYRVCTSWNSPRFAGLLKLDLGGTDSGPSVNQLLRILSNSPRLEHLSLESLKPPEYGALSWPSEPILLNHLRTIEVTKSGTKYVSALLSATQFPQSQSVHLWDGSPGCQTSVLDEIIWSVGNAQTAAVLGMNMAERRRLIILLEGNGINIKNQDSQLQKHFDLIICRGDFSNLLPLIEEFLSEWNPIPDVRLEVGKDAPFLSLLPWSSLLRSLRTKGANNCRKALAELAKQSSPPGSEHASWMCPGLLEISLEYDWPDEENRRLDIEPLYFLLNQRWSNTASDVFSALPASFTWKCPLSQFRELWNSQDELRGILPSFRMARLY
ncbi:hypothetical protein FRC01_009927 [Tulasnella sp. 417]|nr:hypothetical protein FRC01_009927 [Tulasnella sp. 417]